MTNMLSIPIPSNKNGITECTGPKNKPKAEPRPKHTIIPIMTALNRVRSIFEFQIELSSQGKFCERECIYFHTSTLFRLHWEYM